MKKALLHQNYDAQAAGSQYLENIATAYWFSEVLFTAVELDLFSLIGEEGATVQELTLSLGANSDGIVRFLHVLIQIGLVTYNGQRYFNTRLSSSYLQKGKDKYQGDSILWRKHLRSEWQGLKECIRKGGRVSYPDDTASKMTERIQRYIRAMDNIAKTKTHELFGFFKNWAIEGEIVDVGAGSGAVAAAFLERFPLAKATLLDLPDVFSQTADLISRGVFSDRLQCRPANILESWPVADKTAEIVILSNILHAYSQNELPHILRSAVSCLAKDGVLLIHDFFQEHCPEKAALSDLNMLINTYNGRVFSAADVREQLLHLGMFCSDLAPLESDTAVLFASKEKATLDKLHISPIAKLVSRIKLLGFEKIYTIKAQDVHISEWIKLKCRFGCDRYGSHHCPPNAPGTDMTREVIKGYKNALLLQGEPPTRAFQLGVLQAEREAFRGGFHKAFSYWAGPCSLCEICTGEGRCKNTVNARPSMEGSGIDVFETAQRAGAALKTLKDKDGYVKYFALLLLE